MKFLIPACGQKIFFFILGRTFPFNKNGSTYAHGESKHQFLDLPSCGLRPSIMKNKHEVNVKDAASQFSRQLAQKSSSLYQYCRYGRTTELILLSYNDISVPFYSDTRFQVVFLLPHKLDSKIV